MEAASASPTTVLPSASSPAMPMAMAIRWSPLLAHSVPVRCPVPSMIMPSGSSVMLAPIRDSWATVVLMRSDSLIRSSSASRIVVLPLAKQAAHGNHRQFIYHTRDHLAADLGPHYVPRPDEYVRHRLPTFNAPVQEPDIGPHAFHHLEDSPAGRVDPRVCDG